MYAIQCIAEPARNHPATISTGYIITVIFVSAVIIGSIFYILRNPTKKEEDSGETKQE